jgi:hypothetical protein
VPTSPKRADIEITQARNLDVECLPVRDRRTDPYARHGDQDGRRLDWRAANLPLPATGLVAGFGIKAAAAAAKTMTVDYFYAGNEILRF